MIKKSFLLSLAILCFLFANDENILNEEKENKEPKYNQFNQNLDHLFYNSKFPVDDYIYKAQKRMPTEQEIILNDENKQLPPSNLLNSNDEELEKMKAELERIKRLKTEIENNQSKVKREIVVDNQTSYERKIKRLLKDELLSSRNNEIKSFNENSQYGADGFSNQKSIDISTNEHKLYRMIRAGRMIPALLTSAISSDLSGIVTAQIEQDIYASMGNAVLIPRGSKAIGSYTNDAQLGHNRLQIRWREIITPQGVNILLTDAQTSDNMGMSGAIGAVNNKYWERYGIAYSISTLTNVLLLQVASKVDKGNNPYSQEIYSNARSDVSSVVQDMIQQQNKIKPTIEIQSGSRIFLVPTHHMWFAKPKNNEVLMQYFRD